MVLFEEVLGAVQGYVGFTGLGGIRIQTIHILIEVLTVKRLNAYS